MLKKEILYQSLIKNLIKYYNEENNKRKYAMLKYWLPLKQHLIDTKNVALLLWEHWLDESQKNIVKNAINNTDEKVAKKLVGFLANVHDLSLIHI